jgi:ribonuclease R
MISEGKLARTRANRLGLPEKMDLVAGRLACKSGGFGFVRPDRKGEPDIYIAGAALGEALNGDRVLVHIDSKNRYGKPEGHIVEVLERASTSVVGRFAKDSGGARVVPFDPNFLYEVFISHGDEAGAQPGQMVVAELTRYPGPFRAPLGRVVEVLGRLDEPGVDVRVIIAKYALRDPFPDDVRREAERIPTEVSPDLLSRRTDFRGQDIVTIDGETARDFDDAVQVEMTPNGNYVLGVHIADVAHYVSEGSALDREALERGTSVYFPERAVPMLPERLSNGICSLNPGVDRLVQSVRVEVSPTGHVVEYELYDGVIRSAARMTYTEVRQILVDEDPEVRERYRELVPLFERILALYRILRARREKRGSIDFDLPEPEILLDVEGLVTGIVAAERNVAHQIIEEFMLLANEIVAEHLFRLDVPSLYRIHEKPEEDRVEEFEDFIAGFGYRLRGGSESLKPKNFQKLLKQIDGRPEERLISFLMLRTMKQARYAMENVGHYALAASIYTHFTSPIRRYPDLVVHRLLREVRSKGVPSAEKQREREVKLPEVADHASMTERRAEEAERELVEWKKVRFMADKLGDVFVGYVTGVTNFGLFVELEEFFVEGLVHISTLVDDYYRFNEKAHTLRGESSGRLYRLGDRLEVQVVRVDQEKRQIDLAIEGLKPARANRGGPVGSPRAGPRPARRKRGRR